MLHNDVQHRAALVHHGVQLRFHTGGIVLDSHLPHQARRLPQDHIPPGRGGDLRPRRPQQGDIPHDDLPADGKSGRQGRGADGLFGILQKLSDGLPPFLCAHGDLSFLS